MRVQRRAEEGHLVISLDEAPAGYQDFDQGAAKKYVLDPHGVVPAASKREKRLHRLGRRRFAPLRDAADMLAGVSEMAVHAFDSGRQLLEDRLRGRDRSSTSDEEA